MATKRPFKQDIGPLEESEASVLSPSAINRRDNHKRIRRLNPLGMRVLVRLQKESNMTDAGLYLPEGTKENMAESVTAEVIEVAKAVDDQTYEEANISGIPHGAIVLIPKGAGVRVPWDDQLRLVETKEILAIVNEISVV